MQVAEKKTKTGENKQMLTVKHVSMYVSKEKGEQVLNMYHLHCESLKTINPTRTQLDDRFFFGLAKLVRPFLYPFYRYHHMYRKMPTLQRLSRPRTRTGRTWTLRVTTPSGM